MNALMVLMEDCSDGHIRGVSGDTEDGVPDQVGEEGIVGKGLLYWADGPDHLLGDGEFLLLGGEGVR